MTPLAISRVETQGSYWFLDEVRRVYMRVPKREGPRERGPWREPVPGDSLHDLEWHEFISWEVRTEPFVFRLNGRLRHYEPDAFPVLVIVRTVGASCAPRARIVQDYREGQP